MANIKKIIRGLVFQILIKPLLHLLDECILFFKMPMHILDIYTLRLFDLLLPFGEHRYIFFFAHADCRQWYRPLMIEKFSRFLHWCDEYVEVPSIKKEGVFCFAVTAA